MPTAAATPRRKARPGERAGNEEPAPGNRTGERWGCGPRVGLCTHFTDREVERRAARRRRGGGAHSRGGRSAQPEEGAHSRVPDGPQPDTRRRTSLPDPLRGQSRRPSRAGVRLQAV